MGAVSDSKRVATATVRPQIVNDLTCTAATVNGSGSQSANLVLTRAFFAMGIPVAPKNVFPSNIEGLPTWFHVRCSPEGYQARRARTDILVALNRQTWPGDAGMVAPGGVVVHEASFPILGPALREDLHRYPVPFLQLAKEHVANPDQRKYLTNMLYVGVVAEILGIPPAAIAAAVDGQFRSKPQARPANLEAIEVGRRYVREHLPKTDPYRVQPMDATAGQMLVDGNQAAALGAVMGGCTVLSWYPITPSSSLCEQVIALGERYRTDPATGERRLAVVQAEDELAAIGMVLGAAWAGARAMTATSGPGISLMAEFVGFGYYAEIPAVIFDVQRIGPSTGLPTRTLQGDLGFVHTLSHGDARHPVLLPGSVLECYEFGRQAFDLADRLQTPIFVLSDLDLGMNLWMSPPFDYPTAPFDRGKVLGAAELERLEGRWARYRDTDGDGIGWRTLPGTDHPAAGYFARGSGHDEEARYTEDGAAYVEGMDRLRRKEETARALVPAPVVDDQGHPVGLLAYGSSDAAVVEARAALAADGLPTDYLRVRALPLAPAVADFVGRHQRTYVVEQNRDGQMRDLVRLALPPGEGGRLRSIRHYDGHPLPAEVVVQGVRRGEAGTEAPANGRRELAGTAIAEPAPAAGGAAL